MRITAITPMVLGTQWRNLVIVKVETDEGIVGVGIEFHASRGVERRTSSCCAGFPFGCAGSQAGIACTEQGGAEGVSGRGPKHLGISQHSAR